MINNLSKGLREQVDRKHITNTGKILLIASKYYVTSTGSLKLIWEYITSCFGRGFWIGSYPWNGNSAWNGNPK